MNENYKTLEEIFSELTLNYANEPEDGYLKQLILNLETALKETNLWENAPANRADNAKPDRVHLSGSLNKNTAIKGEFDINFVVFAYCRGYHEFLSMKPQFNAAIKEKLEKKFNATNASIHNNNAFVKTVISGYRVKIVVALTTLRKYELVEKLAEYRNSTAKTCIEKIKFSLHQNQFPQLYFSGEIGESVTMVACRKGNDYQEFQDGKKTVLSDLKKILKKEFELSDEKVKVTGSVEFIKNGITFRILPGLTKQNGELHPGTQHLVTLDIATQKRNPKATLKNLNYSMAELEDQFVKDQNEFIRKLIVLLKRWGKSHLSDSSRIMNVSRKLELIAIHVGQKITKCWKAEDHNLFLAFTQCLQVCAEIELSSIEFNYPPNKRYFEAKTWLPPYIRDPINPHKNVLPRIDKGSHTEEHREILRNFAEKAQLFLNENLYSQTRTIDLRSHFHL